MLRIFAVKIIEPILFSVQKTALRLLNKALLLYPKRGLGIHDVLVPEKRPTTNATNGSILNDRCFHTKNASMRFHAPLDSECSQQANAIESCRCWTKPARDHEIHRSHPLARLLPSDPFYKEFSKSISENSINFWSHKSASKLDPFFKRRIWILYSFHKSNLKTVTFFWSQNQTPENIQFHPFFNRKLISKSE